MFYNAYEIYELEETYSPEDYNSGSSDNSSENTKNYNIDKN